MVLASWTKNSASPWLTRSWMPSWTCANTRCRIKCSNRTWPRRSMSTFRTSSAYHQVCARTQKFHGDSTSSTSDDVLFTITTDWLRFSMSSRRKRNRTCPVKNRTNFWVRNLKSTAKLAKIAPCYWCDPFRRPTKICRRLLVVFDWTKRTSDESDSQRIRESFATRVIAYVHDRRTQTSSLLPADFRWI